MVGSPTLFGYMIRTQERIVQTAVKRMLIRYMVLRRETEDLYRKRERTRPMGC